MMKLPIMLVLFTFIFPAISYAQSCRSGASANQNAISKVLSRQLSALRSMQRSRGCRSEDTQGGFFNACRDLSNRIGEIQQQLRTSGTDDCQTGRASSTVRSRATSTTTAASLSRREGGTPTTAAVQPKAARGPKNALTFCVRLSDGYYFPTPHSQFKQKGGDEIALMQCRVICETENMALYVLNDQNDETSDMVALENGRSYADLPTAYNYHGEGDFKRCNWAGYIEKIADLAAAKKHNKKIAVLDTPLPDNKPSQTPKTIIPLMVHAYQPMSERQIRTVGPAFMPDVENKAFTYTDEQE